MRLKFLLEQLQLIAFGSETVNGIAEDVCVGSRNRMQQINCAAVGTAENMTQRLVFVGLISGIPVCMRKAPVYSLIPKTLQQGEGSGRECAFRWTEKCHGLAELIFYIFMQAHDLVDHFVKA